MVSIAACSKTEDPLFVLDTRADLIIPAGLNSIETHFFILRDIPTFFKSQSGLISSDTSQVASIYPRRASMTSVFGNLDLNHIHSMEINLLDPLDQERRIKLFYMDFIEINEKTEIRLFNTNAEIKHFLTQDLFNIEVGILYRNPAFQTEEFRLEMDFAVFEK